MLALHAVGSGGGVGGGGAYLMLGVNFSLQEAHVFTKLVICQGDVYSIMVNHYYYSNIYIINFNTYFVFFVNSGF